eukprot:NODE_5067_length_703_cov_42.593750_g4904_i0.p1 GENE.NODE_5067_length_703_cov_42.593750_g4904_i0~~NODE_5067_length_703_cov_42.593750_g4904_i0.p1  ORF type:complete len:164 (+),score=19.07 NODE_5067_length_703_cov_42.593750_g4904_i0:85-576(+)
MYHLAPQACGLTQGVLVKLLKESDYGGNKNAFNAFFVPATNPAERPEILPRCKQCSNPIAVHQAAAAVQEKTKKKQPTRVTTGALFAGTVNGRSSSSLPSASPSKLSALPSPPPSQKIHLPGGRRIFSSFCSMLWGTSKGRERPYSSLQSSISGLEASHHKGD